MAESSTRGEGGSARSPSPSVTAPCVYTSTPGSIAYPAPCEQDEQLQRSADALCKWLQESEILEVGSLAYTPRVSGKQLIMPDFIVETLRCICPATHQQQLQRYAEAVGINASDLEVATSCLDSVFEAAWGIHVDAGGLLEKALAAGAAGFEPLSDIVWFWKYVLVYAALCESRERHVKWIFSAEPEFQGEVVHMIQQVEARCGVASAASDDNPDAADGALTTSSSPAEDQKPRKKRRSSLSLLGVSPRRQSTSGRSSTGGGAAELLTTPVGGGAVTSTPVPRQSRQSATADTCIKEQDSGQDALALENEILRAQVRQLQEQADKDRQVISRSGAVLDGEFESFCISWNCEKQLKERHEKVKELQCEVHATCQKMDDYNTLFEEVQILRHQQGEHDALKERFARCEEQMERLTARVKEGDILKSKHTEVSKANVELLHEVELLQRDNKNAQIWKRQAQDADAACRLAMMEAEDAKKDAAEAIAKVKAKEEEQELLKTEHSVLTAQLRDAQILRATDAEGGGDRGVVEHFTYELQDKMRSLEQKNALLEQRFTEEEVMEREEFKVLIQRLRDRAEWAEGLQKATIEECKQLRQELQLQQVTAKTLESDLFQTRTAADVTGSELQQCRAELARCSAELEAALNDTSKVEPLEKELQEVKVKLLAEEDQREDLSQELDEVRARFAEREREVQELEPFRVEALDLKRQNDALRQQATSATKFQQEVKEFREIERHLKQVIRENEVNFENYKRHCEEENQSLRSQLSYCRYEKDQAARNSEGLVELQDELEQKQGLWSSREEDLQQGLKEELENKLRLEEKNALLESKVQQFEELLEQKAPADLQRLKQRLERCKIEARSATACLSPDYEVMLKEREVQRLSNELQKRRLHEADLVQQLRRESAKNRQAERTARATPLPSEMPAQLQAGATACVPTTSRTRSPLQELPVHQLPVRDFLPKGASKPASALPTEEATKENQPVFAPGSEQSKPGQKATRRRVGLIG